MSWPFMEELRRSPPGMYKTRRNILGQTTLLRTNISPTKALLKMIFPFPKVGYVSSLEGTS